MQAATKIRNRLMSELWRGPGLRMMQPERASGEIYPESAPGRWDFLRASGGAAAGALPRAQPRKPNRLIIPADDMGFFDAGC